MINFIICDDEPYVRQNVKEVINRLMMNNKLEYKIHDFDAYDSKFLKIINESLENKIYILDIEVKDKSGINKAVKIREMDWHSIIIMLTCHDDFLYDSVKKKLMLLNFIFKMDDYKERLHDTLKTALCIMDLGKKIVFKSHGMLHNIRVDDINYIVKNQAKRTLTIKTKQGEHQMTSSLVNVRKKMPDYFVITHKSALVNSKNIKSINYKMGKILFEDGSSLDLLSKNYRKEVSKYVNN